MTEACPSPPRAPDSYWLMRFVILRWLGGVYAVAFFAAANQILPLIGSHGLLPVDAFLVRVQNALGSPTAGFLRLPSLFWFAHSDAVLQLAAWAGFALSCVVAAGYANALVMATLWALYMSFVHVGQEWYGYGWEIQLLETGFLSIFLCPLLDGRPFPRREPPRVILWLFRWLIFRIMLGAALIKLRGDPGALSLLGENPFPERPPRYIRAVLYRYRFSPLGNPEGHWWERQELGLWLPPLSADDPRLLNVLKQAGWLGNTDSVSP